MKTEICRLCEGGVRPATTDEINQANTSGRIVKFYSDRIDSADLADGTYIKFVGDGTQHDTDDNRYDEVAECDFDDLDEFIESRTIGYVR